MTCHFAPHRFLPASVEIGVVLFGLACLLGGCTTAFPVYLDTGLDASLADAMTTNTEDSVRVTVTSRMTATLFSPFDRNYIHDRKGAFGLRVPIQKVFASRVEHFSEERFQRLEGVIRRPPAVDFMARDAIERAPPKLGATAAGSPILLMADRPAQLIVTLVSFRVKEYSLAEPADSVAKTNGPEASPDSLVRGARMWVRVGLYREGDLKTTNLTGNVQRSFRDPKAAAWKPVLDALNDQMIVKLDRHLANEGL